MEAEGRKKDPMNRYECQYRREQRINFEVYAETETEAEKAAWAYLNGLSKARVDDLDDSDDGGELEVNLEEEDVEELEDADVCPPGHKVYDVEVVRYVREYTTRRVFATDPEHAREVAGEMDDGETDWEMDNEYCPSEEVKEPVEVSSGN
jgi:hypothetical protein